MTRGSCTLKKKDMIKIRTSLDNFCEEHSIEVYLTDEDLSYAMVGWGAVYINEKGYMNPTSELLFDYLHEIGHIMTNDVRMKRYEMEFLATEWAIKNANEFNVTVTRERIDDYQYYIEGWRHTAIRRHGKNINETKEPKTPRRSGFDGPVIGQIKNLDEVELINPPVKKKIQATL